MLRSGRRWLLGACAAVAALGAAPAASPADGCANAPYRTGPSAALPDCRAYEQVTPADKGGDIPGGQGVAALASLDASKLFFKVNAPLAGISVGDGVREGYVATRTSAGWSTTPVPPADAGDYYYFAGQLLSEDLATIVADKQHETPGAFTDSVTPGFPKSVVRGPAGGPFTSLADLSYDSFGLQLGDVFIEGGTPDTSHVVFASHDTSLTPAAAGITGGRALSEWADGQIRLVSVDDGGSPTSACGAMLGAGGWEGGDSPGVFHPPFNPLQGNAVSRDGSRIFFSSPDWDGSPDFANCATTIPQLYLRSNGSTTIELSKPVAGVSDPDGPQPVVFEGAAANGSRAYFVTSEWLTPDVTTHDPELYEYDVASGTVTRVSRGDSGDADGDVLWALISDDGSTAYFAARGALAPGATSADSSHANLYRYAGGTTTFIAQVSSEDGREGGTNNGPAGDISWYTTPDGEHLLFSSTQNLTAYDAGGTQELYRYDASARSLICVSCRPDGGPAAGPAEFTALPSKAQPFDYQPIPMTDDGRSVFFDSPDPLTPKATNGTDNNVFEWRDGELRLISDGVDAYRSAVSSFSGSMFLTATHDGHDVFFVSHDRLAPSDDDRLGDIYDARVSGGFAAPASPAPGCSGDACQGEPSAAPQVPDAGSVTFYGALNASSRPTARMKVSKRAIVGSRVTLSIKVPARGHISASGRGVTRRTRSLVVVNAPQLAGVVSGARGPPLNASLSSSNGCCGLSENVVVSRPVSSGTASPRRRSVAPSPARVTKIR
jgi:hypothetical protein